MLELISFPSATSTILEASAYSNPWFSALLPIVYIGIGIPLGVMIILWLKEKIWNALTYLFTGGQGPTDSLGNPSDINIHYRNPPYKQ